LAYTALFSTRPSALTTAPLAGSAKVTFMEVAPPSPVATPSAVSVVPYETANW
jgi:hypothetical protein